MSKNKNLNSAKKAKLNKLTDQQINFHEALIASEASLSAFAKELHNSLRDNIRLNEAQKPLLLSAVLIALKSEAFISGIKAYEESDLKETLSYRKEHGELMKQLHGAIAKVLRDSDIPQDKAVVIETTLSFLRVIGPLYEVATSGKFVGHTNLYSIIFGIHQEVVGSLLEETGVDLVGKFYGEFVRYTGGDGSGLGIVLTPSHISDLMTELAGIHKDSIVYDPCTGTGRFLITAMSKMLSMANGDKDKEAQIKSSQLCGVEANSDMYVMAAAGMIFRGDGKANIHKSSCFAIESRIIDYGPTCAILNPPYSQKAVGLREIDFISHACKVVETGGKVVAIVPKSVFIDSSNQEAKADLMSENTIESVITVPNNLFYNVSTLTVIVVVKVGIPHSGKTYFYDFSDDGFEVVLKHGRVDRNFEERRETLLLDIDTKNEIPGISAYVEVGPCDEFIIEAYYETDYDNLNFVSFFNTYIASEANKYTKLLENSISILIPSSDTSDWCLFEYTDVFDFNPCGSKNYSVKEANKVTGGNRLIGASEYNNGVTCRTGLDNTNEAGTITVANNGSIGASFYQSCPYSKTADVTVLRVKGHSLTEVEGIFITTLIELEKPKYNYGRKWGLARMKKSKIKLPVTEDGSIDWNWINDFSGIIDHPTLVTNQG